MDSSIRQGTVNDLAASVGLWNEAQSARRGVASVYPGMLELVRTRFAARNAILLIAEELGEVIGFAQVCPAGENDGAGQVIPGLAHIGAVSVKPGCWGRGFGRRLMTAVIEEMPRRGYTRAQLWTQKTNDRALRLYTDLGFVFTGDEKTDDEMGERIGRYILAATPRSDA